MSVPFSRRQSLRMLGAFSISLTCGVPVSSCSSDSPMDRLDTEALKRIGRSYRRTIGGRVTVGGLSADLGLTTDEPFDAATGALLNERILDDHRAGRLIEIDGWLLSETEAELATLAADAPNVRTSLAAGSMHG